METWEVVIFCLLALFVGIAILMLTDGKEKIRCKKHPIWYEHYNRAKHNSFMAGSKHHKQEEVFKARSKMIQDMLFNGKCTADEYNEAMRSLYEDVCTESTRYMEELESLGIMQDLEAADAYAKEHNLKWGILFK
jgi:hypothetical protein